jgi:hypothetical protein
LRVGVLSDLRWYLETYHLVHFDGHGTYLPCTGVGALCFEDGEARLDLITGQRLGDLLARLEVLRTPSTGKRWL